MISVIIPLYNAEKTIQNTLDSVRNQTIGASEFEIIIINDGSTDNSVAVIENFQNQFSGIKILLLHQENSGVSVARNAGLKVAKGEFIAFLDSDDVWLTNKTERQLSFLTNPKFNLDFIACERNGDRVRFPYQSDKNKLAKVTFRKLLLRNGIANTSIFKRKVLENTGMFDEKMTHGEDHDFYFRVSQHNKMAILNESLVITGNGKKSFGESGLSANLEEMEKGFQYRLKKLYQSKKLNWLAYTIYSFYFSVKYFIRKIRR